MRGQLLLVAFLGLATSACTVVEMEKELEGCQDLTVGETQQFRPHQLGGTLDLPKDKVEAFEWFLSGPGGLEPGPPSSLSPLTVATYTATDPGRVRVGYEAQLFRVLFASQELDVFVTEVEEWLVSCTFEVATPAQTSPPTSESGTTPLPEPGPRDGYNVITVVVVSNVEGVAPVGAQSESTWTFAFGCPDGRCDAEVRDGGPYGSLPPFTTTYRAGSEDFAFDFALETPANELCGDDRWVGGITPTAWDERGPVEFTVRFVNVLACDSGDVVIEWEGEGARD